MGRVGGLRGVGWDEMESEVVELPYWVSLGRVVRYSSIGWIRRRL